MSESLIGQKKHLLTVKDCIKEGNRQFLICICQCGNQTAIRKEAFGKNKSCGCIKLASSKYQIGQRYNCITIKKILGPHLTKNKRSLLICQCDCGKVIKLYPERIGKAKSCGCNIGGRPHNWKGYGNLSRDQWTSYIRGAKDRNIEFDLSIKYAWEKYIDQKGRCAISGIPIDFIGRKRTASLDRIDSSKGYIENNIQWVHKKVNVMKLNLDQNDFIDFCQKISAFTLENYLEAPAKLDFQDVMIVPKFSNLESRSQVNILSKQIMKYSQRALEAVPVMAANMDTVGTFEMAKSLNKENFITCLHKFYDSKSLINFWETENTENIFYSIGLNKNDYSKIQEVSKNVFIENICIDVANGYTEKFINFCRKIRSEFPESTIMAGNVATAEGVYNLVTKGAVDIVKCGIGSGASCLTRVIAGVGMPQFSAITECVAEANKLGAMICSDGGVKHIGDISKAIGAGSHYVMCGSLFAGHDESKKEWGENENVMNFYGMSSEEAMIKHYGEVSDYRAAEGKSVFIPRKGPVAGTLKTIMGGIRSSCTYTNHDNIDSFRNNVTFCRVKRTHNESLS